MNYTGAIKNVGGFCLGLLLLTLGLLNPGVVNAQEQGSGATQNPASSWVDLLLGGPTQTGDNSGGWTSWFGGNANPAQGNGNAGVVTQYGNVIGNMGEGVTNNPLVNGFLDTVIGIGNTTGVWPNGSGNPIIDGTVNIIVDGITAVVNIFAGGVSGDPVETGDAQGSDTHSGGSNSTVTEQGEHGNDSPSSDAGRQSGGSGSAPSIPGASRGTVGNPFSDGTDKNDAPSDNDETTSNPYLFEYDPSSTNNNPSGAGSMDR